MIENVLRAIGGIGVFDTISICLFVVVFTGSLLWAARLKKPFLNSMSELPLQDEAGRLAQKGDHDHA